MKFYPLTNRKQVNDMNTLKLKDLIEMIKKCGEDCPRGNSKTMGGYSLTVSRVAKMNMEQCSNLLI